jgi:Skp family chaperone for outer membrane proteins
MNITVRLVSAFAVGMALLVASGQPTRAADKIPAPVIMVVDIPKVINECKQTKKIRETRQTMAEKYNKEFDVEGSKLREEEKQLSEQRSILTPEAFVEKQKAFAVKVGNFEKRVRVRTLALDSATDNAMRQLKTQMDAIIQELAKEYGSNFVLSRTQVEYFDTAMDKTDALMDRVNTKVKEIIFPDPIQYEKEIQKEVQSRLEADKARAAASKDSKDSKKK